jgi:hypothetical protein
LRGVRSPGVSRGTRRLEAAHYGQRLHTVELTTSDKNFFSEGAVG